MNIILFIFLIINLKCYSLKRNQLLSNVFTKLRTSYNIYDGNDNRYNITNNLPIKNLNSTHYEELSCISHISNDEEINLLSNIGKNIHMLKLLKKLLNKNISEIEKLKEIKSYETEEESKFKLNLKAGGLFEDWDMVIFF
jgi:hypothetical protein